MGFITSCFADFFVKSISMKHKFLSNSPATTFQKLFKTGAYKRVITPTHPSYSIAMATEFWQACFCQIWNCSDKRKLALMQLVLHV